MYGNDAAILKRRTAALRYAVAVAAVAGASLLDLWLAPHTYRAPFLLYFPAVVVAAWFGGFRPGILATALSTLAANYFMLPPANQFSVDLPNLVLTTFFALSFASICWFADLARRQVHSVIEIQTQLLEMSFEAVMVRDAADRVIYWNRGAERLYGWSKDEARGRVTHELLRTVHPRPLEEVRAELDSNGRWHGELIHTRKDGSTVVVDSWWTLRKGGDKQSAILEVNYDLTERKKAEESLREGEQQFRTLADSIPQLAWMANPDGWIFWYNRRWYEYTGTTPEMMQGWGWQSVHHPAELPRVLERWQSCLQTGNAFDMVFPLRGADGLFRPFLTRILPLKDAAGKVVRWFGTNTDISAQKNAEEALVKHEKLATVGRMAATIAHEINNPLAAAINAIYLAGTAELPEAARAHVEMAERELERVAHITKQTLGFYRESGSPGVVRLAGCAGRRAGAVRAQAAEQIGAGGMQVRQRQRSEWHRRGNPADRLQPGQQQH